MAESIIRVFPRRTSYTPDDALAFSPTRGQPHGAYPPLLMPRADRVWVSVTFTWDINEGQRLRDAWRDHFEDVQIGGPAFGSPGTHFEPGCFVKRGIVFTSRGCNNYCPYCLVPAREGRLQLVWPIADGHIIQDNNFLACPATHRRQVYAMLDRQPRAAVFKGGLEPALVTDDIAAEFRDIRISEAWLACDTEAALKPLDLAVKKLQFLGPGSNKLRCYVLIGRGKETIESAAGRLQRVWESGAMPFAQLYQPAEDKPLLYPREWRELARTWMRPAAMRVMHSGAGGRHA